MKSTLGRLFALVLALVLVTPAAAMAADELSLSRDRDSWAPMTEPLFDPATRWVPGDSRTETFYARNNATDDASLRVRLNSNVDDLRQYLAVEISYDGGAWQPLGDDWTSDHALNAGEISQIDVRIELPQTAGNSSQRLTFGFDVEAVLTYGTPPDPTEPTPAPTETTPTTGPTTGVDGDSTSTGSGSTGSGSSGTDDGLSWTGAAFGAWIPALGLGALITGIWLAIANRRRDDEEEERELS